MNQLVSLLLAISTMGMLSGCMTTLSDQAKLLAATQECGSQEPFVQNPVHETRHAHCVEVTLDSMQAQEAAYERGQTDVLVGLAKALESPVR